MAFMAMNKDFECLFLSRPHASNTSNWFSANSLRLIRGNWMFEIFAMIFFLRLEIVGVWGCSYKMSQDSYPPHNYRRQKNFCENWNKKTKFDTFKLLKLSERIKHYWCTDPIQGNDCFTLFSSNNSPVCTT